MDERVGMDHLQRSSQMDQFLKIPPQSVSCGQGENGPNPLSGRKDTVTALLRESLPDGSGQGVRNCPGIGPGSAFVP